MRSLDFTSCVRNCKAPCFRKLSKEEENWLETNSNRHSYSYFEDCSDFMEDTNETSKNK